MVDKPDDPPVRGSPLGILLANAALVATLFAFVMIAVRALVVARLDPTTAVGLVQTSGPVNVFVGTLTVTLPHLLFLLCAALLLARRYLSRPLISRASTYIALAIVGTILLFVGHWTFPLGVIAMAIQIRELDDRESAVRWLARVSTRFVAFVTIVFSAGFLLAFLTSPDVWLPQERLQLSGGGIVFGYVLEEDGRWVSILEEDDRELLFVEQDGVESREACASDSGDNPSLADLLKEVFGDPPARPTYPPCSE